MTHTLTCPKCDTANVLDGAVALAAPQCSHCHSPLPWLHEGTDATFASDVQASVPVLVDFWAPWCGPCRIVGSILEEVAAELAGKVRVVKVDVDQNPQSPGQFQVQGIPTIVMFLNDEPVDEIIGAVPKFMLLDRVKHLINLKR